MADKVKKNNVISLAKVRRERSGSGERGFEKLWGPDLKRIGFTQVPKLLLRAQSRLGLSATQLVVLLQLMEHWWERSRLPYPAKERIADRMGINPRQVQRVMKALEDAGLVRRIERRLQKGGKTTNEYDLAGLARKLQKMVPEFIKVEEEAKQKRREVVRPAHKRVAKAPKQSI